MYFQVAAGKSAWRVLLIALCSALIQIPAQTVVADTVHTQEKPSVMVLLQEKVMGVFNTTGWEVPTQAELTLMGKLREQGFTVIDPETVRRNVVQAQGLRMLEADDHSAASVGLQHGARLSILGTAISKPAGAKLYDTQMQSIQATVTARVIQNDTAVVIATGSATAAWAHIDEVQGGALALEDAALSLAEELIPKILASVDVPAGESRSLMLNISGLKSYRHLDYVLYYFESGIEGIKGVYLDEFTNNVARVRLDYNDRAAVLARAIARKKFRGFRLEPMEVTESRLDLSVIGE